VQRFGAEDYYISTDTCYSYNYAVKVIKALVELVRQGFEVVFIGD
jgi:predicted nicotinamide N-methyase